MDVSSIVNKKMEISSISLFRHMNDTVATKGRAYSFKGDLSCTH